MGARATRTAICAVVLAIGFARPAPAQNLDSLSAPLPMAGPLNPNDYHLSFGYSDDGDRISYGPWLSVQDGWDAVSILFDLGFAPAHFERTNALVPSASMGPWIGFRAHAALGLKVILLDYNLATGALFESARTDHRVGAVVYAKGSGTMEMFQEAPDKGHQFGAEVGVVLSYTAPVFLGISVEVHPFLSLYPVASGQLSFSPEKAMRHDLMRVGMSLQVSWDDNPTPLLGSIAVKMDEEDGGDRGLVWVAAIGAIF